MEAYVGQQVSLLLKEGGRQYCGRLITYNRTDKKFVLSKVMCMSTKKYLPGNQIFFSDEIIADSLAVVDETKSENLSLDEVSLVGRSRRIADRGDNSNFSNTVPIRKELNRATFHLGTFFEQLKNEGGIDEVQQEVMTANMYDRRTELSSRADWLAQRHCGMCRPTSYKVIDQLGEEFDEAVYRIESEQSIGVAFTGSNISRRGALYWIQIAASDLVYLFDIFTMGDLCISRGLGRILTSTTILKVTHDCRYISDLLFHQHEIKMVNIFDTQAAAVLAFRAENNGSYPAYVNSLQNLIEDHIPVLPNEYRVFKVKEALKEMEERLWSSRPLNDLLLDSLAKSVSYLNELKKVLLKGMLKDFYIAVDSYASELRDKESTDHSTQPHILPAVFTKMQKRDERRRVEPHGLSKNNPDGLVEHVPNPSDISYKRDSIMHRHIQSGLNHKLVSHQKRTPLPRCKSATDKDVTSLTPTNMVVSKPQTLSNSLAVSQPMGRGRGTTVKINGNGFVNSSQFPVRSVGVEGNSVAKIGEQVHEQSSPQGSALTAMKTQPPSWLETHFEGLHRQEQTAHPLNTMGLADGFQNVELMGLAPLLNRQNAVLNNGFASSHECEGTSSCKLPVSATSSGSAHRVPNNSSNVAQGTPAYQTDIEWDD